MLFCCIAVFQYYSIICQCGASTNAFTVCCVRCITYHLQVACTHKRPSVPHIEPHESACCKYKMRHVWVNKSMDAVTAGDHWLRCRHHLRLQLPLPRSLIPFCGSRYQWISNGRAGFWIRDRDRQVFKTVGRSGSATNTECEAGYNATRWVWLWSTSECWWATTACTQHGCWCNHWPSLCTGQGYRHVLSDIAHARIDPRWWRGGVPTRDCRGYGTLAFRGIPLASRSGNTSVWRGTKRIPWRSTLFWSEKFIRPVSCQGEGFGNA